MENEELEKLKKDLERAKELLSELMNIYMITADEEGMPTKNIIYILNTWVKVKGFLKIINKQK